MKRLIPIPLFALIACSADMSGYAPDATDSETVASYYRTVGPLERPAAPRVRAAVSAAPGLPRWQPIAVELRVPSPAPVLRATLAHLAETAADGLVAPIERAVARWTPPPVRFCGRDWPSASHSVTCHPRKGETLLVAPLKGLPALRELVVYGRPSGHEIRGLGHLQQLTSLELHAVTPSHPDEIEQLGGLRALLVRDPGGAVTIPTGAALKSLAVYGDIEIGDLTRFSGLSELRLGPRVRFEEPSIGALTGLRVLDVPGLTSLAFLGALRELRTLRAVGLDATSLAPLSDHPTLEQLDLSEAVRPATWRPLSTLSGLRHLTLASTDFSSLRDLPRGAPLEHMDLSFTPVRDLRAIRGQRHLETLVLTGTKVRRLAPLRGMRSLRMVFLEDTRFSGCDWPGDPQTTAFCRRNVAPFRNTEIDLVLWDEPGC